MDNTVRRIGLSVILAMLVGAAALVAAVHGQASVDETATVDGQATPGGDSVLEDADGAPAAECVPDQLLVKFRPGADPAGVSSRHGATFTGAIVGLDVHVLTVPAGTVPEKMAAFSTDPDVVYAEPNGIARVPEAPTGGVQACGVGPASGG